jgi:hypothetical protein
MTDENDKDHDDAIETGKRIGYRNHEIETIKADLAWLKKLVYAAVGLAVVGWAKTIGLIGDAMK